MKTKRPENPHPYQVYDMAGRGRAFDEGVTAGIQAHREAVIAWLKREVEYVHQVMLDSGEARKELGYLPEKLLGELEEVSDE